MKKTNDSLKRQMEILAPAGNTAGVIAAINGGADAVYLGSKKFNARQKAGNFDHSELQSMIQLCHDHDVKVYLTVNTLIKDSELQDAADEARCLWQMGADALIVQDPGLIMILRAHYPEIVLQTSTQASVFGLAGVLFFQNLGFKRVVLPREMSLDEVALIREKSDIELKVFGHGALCYAYSGQCLFSSLIGGRSGNRGCCAQPCRKKYQLKTASGKILKSGYLMSMKDLNTRASVEKIADAGVSSLKIEGRMKGAAYIYATSKAYGQTLSGEKSELRDRDLKQLFNREFTEGWLMKDPHRLNQTMGRNQGIQIGQVHEKKKDRMTIRLQAGIMLKEGDGLSFGTDAVKGMTLKRFSQKGSLAVIETGLNCPCGTPVFRTMDSVLMESLDEKAAKPVFTKKEFVDIRLSIHENEPVRAKISAFNDSFDFESAIIPAKAHHHPVTKEMSEAQMRKFGGTAYEIRAFDADISGEPFLSKGELNAIRREVLQILDEKRNGAESSQRQLSAINVEACLKRKKHPVVTKPVLSLALPDIMCATEDITPFLETDADEVVIPLLPDRERTKKWLDLACQYGKKTVLALPRVMDSWEEKRFLTEKAHLFCFPADIWLVPHYEGLQLLRNTGLKLEAGEGLHCFNRASAEALHIWGCSSAELSPELTGKAAEMIAKNSEADCVMSVFGFQEMMASKNCLMDCQEKHCEICKDHALRFLEDERGAVFPVYRDLSGTTRIFNSDKLFLKQQLSGMKHISKWRIRVLNESPEEIEAILAFYRNGFEMTKDGIPSAFSGRYTTGNYKREIE